VCLPVLCACACASYRVGSVNRQLPGGYQAVAVPVFKNQTHEAGVEVYFTNALIREMERSRIASVTDKSGAQATLEGSVDSVVYAGEGPEQGDSNNSPIPAGSILNTSFRVIASVSLRLRRNSDQRVLWEGVFNKEQSYHTPQIGIEPLTS